MLLRFKVMQLNLLKPNTNIQNFGVMENNDSIIKEINRLKKEKNAIVMAHYYTRPEIQDIADYLGDSLGLSREAGKTEAQIIIFCGVHFMAETASIISPQKKVLIPKLNAGCSLAESITGYELKKWKAENPKGIIVSYVNTTAEVKAYTDICCTSSNALKVVESIPKDTKILFVPDVNLGSWIAKKTGREIELWDGNCCVHHAITTQMIIDMHNLYPEADILIHPEAICSHDDTILDMPQTYMYSTSGMINHTVKSPKTQFIIATEIGTIHQMKKLNPNKEFIPISKRTICGQMRKATLKDVLEVLKNETNEVNISDDIRKKAIVPIERMLKIG